MPSKSVKASSTKSKAKSTAATAPSRVEQARAAAERAVDVPVGAVLEVSDRVSELVEPFVGRDAAQKQLKTYGTSLRRTVKRTERRGAGARRKAAAEARKTRNRIERETRARRERVEERVRQVADQLPAFR